MANQKKKHLCFLLALSTFQNMVWPVSQNWKLLYFATLLLLIVCFLKSRILKKHIFTLFSHDSGEISMSRDSKFGNHWALQHHCIGCRQGSLICPIWKKILALPPSTVSSLKICVAREFEFGSHWTLQHNLIWKKARLEDGQSERQLPVLLVLSVLKKFACRVQQIGSPCILRDGTMRRSNRSTCSLLVEVPVYHSYGSHSAVLQLVGARGNIIYVQIKLYQ